MSTQIPPTESAPVPAMPELSRLKRLWSRLPVGEQACWEAKFTAPEPDFAAIREELLLRVHINLPTDQQAVSFQKFLAEEAQRQAVGDQMQANEDRLKRDHPDWKRDQVRDEVLRAAYLEAYATGDHKLGLATVTQEMSIKKFGLAREKYVFDATEKCMEKLPELIAIREDSTLSLAEKLDRIRMKLFGELAE